MTNLEYYDKLRTVPENAQKKITGGRLNGKTDINPMWRIKALTELFGPCGIGWKYSITDKRLEQGADGEVAAFVKLGLEVLDFLFGGGLVGIAGAIGEFGQDVCGVVLGELGGVVVVEFLCIGLSDAGTFVNEVLDGL